MFVVDDTVWKGKDLDAETARIIHVMGLRGLRSPNGKEMLGCPLEQNVWLTIEPVNGVSQGAKQTTWIGGRLTPDGKGFRMAEGETMHQAAVSAMKIPSPTYSIGTETAVLDMVVTDEVQAKEALVERLTDHQRAPAF